MRSFATRDKAGAFPDSLGVRTNARTLRKALRVSLSRAMGVGLGLLMLGFVLEREACAAPVPAFTISAVNSFFPSSSFAFGMGFNVTQAGDITAVGYFDPDNSGFVGSHTIGIYSAGNTLLLSVVLASGTSDPYQGFFRFHDITPLHLNANQTYTIVGTTTDRWTTTAGNRATGYTLDPLVNFVSNGVSIGASLALPTIDASAEHYLGPNFLFSAATTTPVPEPSLLLLVGVAGAALARNRTRRTRSSRDSRANSGT